MGKYFNIEGLSMDSPLIELFQSYLEDYPDPIPDTDEDYSVNCYIEEYNNNGRLAARLRDKETNKKISFWASPNDIYAPEMKKELLIFMSDTKRMNKPDFFDRNGKSSIYIMARLLKETDDMILLSGYFAELLYQGDASLLD